MRIGEVVRRVEAVELAPQPAEPVGEAFELTLELLVSLAVGSLERSPDIFTERDEPVAERLEVVGIGLALVLAAARREDERGKDG